MRKDKLKPFLWILPVFLLGFRPGSASDRGEPAGGGAAPSGGTAALVSPDLGEGGLSAEEREIVSRMEILENLELLRELELYEDFFLLLEEDDED